MSEYTYTGAVPMSVLADQESRIKTPGTGERDPIWFTPRGHEMTLQFIADPHDTVRGFVLFREAQVGQILLPGKWATGPWQGTPRADLPWHLRDVPMQDIEMVDPTHWRYRRDFVEVTPGQLLSLTDDVLDARSQRFPGENGRVNVEWVGLTNVIVHAWPQDIKKKDGSDAAKPEIGSHILLKMSKRQTEMLVERLIEKSEDMEIDPREWTWLVTFIGGTPNKLILKKGERITEPLEYEPYDILGMLGRKRQAFIEHISALNVAAGRIRSWIESVSDPPVEIFTTASVACLMRPRKGRKSSGSTEGAPVSGFRACK